MKNIILIIFTIIYTFGLKAQYFDQIYNSNKTSEDHSSNSYVSYQESTTINNKKGVNIIKYKRNNSTVYYKVYDENSEIPKEVLDTIVVLKTQLKDTLLNKNIGISTYKRNVNVLYFNNNETTLEYDPSTNTFYDQFNEIYYDFYSYDPNFYRQVYVPRNHSGQIIVLYRDNNSYRNFHHNEYKANAPKKYKRNNQNTDESYNLTRKSSRNTYSTNNNTNIIIPSETRKSSRSESKPNQTETPKRSYNVSEESSTRKSSRSESSTRPSETRSSSSNSNSTESSGTRKSSRR